MSIQLRVEDIADDDSSIARLSSKLMDQLELFHGDQIKLKGKKRRETICIVLSDETCNDNCIMINQIVQNNLLVSPDDSINIEVYRDVVHGTSIDVSPIGDVMKEIDGNLLKGYLQSYFYNAYRPVHIGDRFLIQKDKHLIEFQVIRTEPHPQYCLVMPETKIECTHEIFKYEIDFDDIGGLDKIKQRLEDLVNMSPEKKKNYPKYRVIPDRAVLLYGPPGCGKTMLAKARVTERNMNFISFDYQDLFHLKINDTRDYVCDIFDKACQMSSCVLLIKHLDDLIYIPYPDENTRFSILRITLKGRTLAKNIDLTFLAKFYKIIVVPILLKFVKKSAAYQ